MEWPMDNKLISKMSKYLFVRPMKTIQIKSKYLASMYCRNSFYYFVYLMINGNSMDTLSSQFRMSYDLSGGMYIICHILLIVLLVLPLIYAEIFLGKYAKVANSHVHQMVPLFFGYSVLSFLLYLVSFQNKMNAMRIFGTWIIKLVTNNYLVCPKQKGTICYDAKVNGPIKDCIDNVLHARYFQCADGRKYAYVFGFHFWEHYLMEESGSSTYYVVINFFTELVNACIVFLLSLLQLKVLGILLLITFIIHFLTCITLLLYAMNMEEGIDSLNELFQLRRDSATPLDWMKFASAITFSYDLGFSPGPMTYAAYTQSHLGAGIQSLIVVVIGSLLTFFYLILTYASSAALGSIYGVHYKSMYMPFSGTYLATYMELFRVRGGNYGIYVILLALSVNYILEFTSSVINIKNQLLNVYDWMPRLAKHHKLVQPCFILFLLGTYMVLPNAYFTTTGAEKYSTFRSHVFQMILLTIQSALIFWSYTVPRLCDDIHFVAGSRPTKMVAYVWYAYPLVTLTASIFMFLYKIGVYADETSMAKEIKRDVKHTIIPTDPSDLVNVFLGLIAFTFIYMVLKAKDYEPLRKLLKPTYYWGPLAKYTRICRKLFAPNDETRFMIKKADFVRLRDGCIKTKHMRESLNAAYRGHVFIDEHFT